LAEWHRPRPREIWVLTSALNIIRVLTLAGLSLAAGCAPHGKAYVGADKRVAAEPATPLAGQLSPSVDAAMRRAADPTLAPVDAATALAINAGRPFDRTALRPMRPFVLKAVAADRARAVECLAQAVYYEAAREPLRGQRAVAQVVLNRLRHPDYPKSVCGVVFEGAARPTGCQFTFTCDGALRWRPEPALWREAQDVARRALAGYVERDVGSATHYHAAYVAPYWAPSLVKMTQVGQHIFYRWGGAWGEPATFRGRYAGGEAVLTTAVLGGAAPAPALREVALGAGGAVRTYKVADAAVPNGVRARVVGVIIPTRRQPTPDEIKAVNARLAELERQLVAKGATEPAATADAAPPVG
jgi:spore germination cell wall hydrolase CwlJ-like protein